MAVAAMAVKKQRRQAEQRALQIQVRPEQVTIGHDWWLNLNLNYVGGNSGSGEEVQ